MKPTIKSLTAELNASDTRLGESQAERFKLEEKVKKLTEALEGERAACSQWRRNADEYRRAIIITASTLSEAQSRAVSNRGAAADKIALDLLLSVGSAQNTLRL